MCGRIAESERREWLVTNGIGGFASGTVAGLATRRYHGLLVAALAPPLGRRLLVSAIDEIVTVDDVRYELGAHRWASGALAPQGYRYLERFELDGTVPVWTYACAATHIEKRVWMEHGANCTYVRYRLLRGAAALALKVLVNDRDFHGNTHAGHRPLHVEACANGVRVATELTPLEIRSDAGDAVAEYAWYRDALLARETARSLDDRDDALFAATFRATLQAGETLTVACAAPGLPDVHADAAYARAERRDAALLAAFREANGANNPRWIERFALAADAFVVRRTAVGQADARSIVAGYHWFGDWGRDTMIALPGLALCTGRAPIAATIIETFANYVDDGCSELFPGRGSDAGVQYRRCRAVVCRSGASLLRVHGRWCARAARLHGAGGNRRAVCRGDALRHPARPRRASRDGRARRRADVDGRARRRPGYYAAHRASPSKSMRFGSTRSTRWHRSHRSPASTGRHTKRCAKGRALVSRAIGIPNAPICTTFSMVRLDPTRRCGPMAIFAAALPASALAAEQCRALVDTCARELLTSFGLPQPRAVG